jgi:hypothetical protein
VQAHSASVQILDLPIQLRAAVGKTRAPAARALASALPAGKRREQRQRTLALGLARVKSDVERDQVRARLAQPALQSQQLAQIARKLVESFGANQLRAP